MTNKFLRFGRNREFDHTGTVPELVEVGHLDFLGLGLGERTVVEGLDPVHLGFALGEFLFLAQTFGQGGKDVVVVACLEHRLDDLLHPQDGARGVITNVFDVVAFHGGRCRQHDVGVAGRGRPLEIMNDKGFDLLEGLDHAVAILMVGKGIATHPIDHLDIGIFALLAVVIVFLARVQEHVADPCQRDRRRSPFRQPGGPGNGLAAVGDAGQHRSIGAGRTATRIMVAEAKATSRLTNLAKHRGQRDQHPVPLFAQMLTLDGPSGSQHRAVLGEALRQLLEDVGRNTANFCGPFGGLRRLVGLTHEVGLEFVKARGVVLQELFVVQLFGDQGMRDAEHHRHVGLRFRRDPFGVEVGTGFGLERVDADDLLALFLVGLHADVGIVIGNHPADLVGQHRVSAPEHQQIRTFDNHRPDGLLLINFQRADNVRHDDLGGSGRVIARTGDKTTAQIHQAAQHVLAVVQFAGALPAIGTGERGLRGNALQFLGHQIKRLIPSDADKIARATGFRRGTRHFFQVGATHHRVFDAAR